MNENKKKQYIAVTVGPIFDTMSLVSTPAALWASSYMFSLISKTLCEMLCKNGVKEENIITPYYSESDKALLGKNDGVGLFHDHIIFAAEDFDIKSFNAVKEAALGKIADIFEIDAGYLKNYVQIAAVRYEAENPIFGCENILNSRELEKPFVAQDSEQPLLKMLFAGEDSANELIKKIAVKLGINEKWQLTLGKKIKDLNMIVNPNPKAKPEMKKHLYYAVVRSDGDNMSKIISSLKGDGEFRSFSETCLSYCSAVSDEVAKFGGVTVYSGGDDLLAILPCENRDGKTPFEFIKSANKIFKDKFDRYNKPTSLSYGIVMCYYKFPLYEALEESAELLFGVAKDEKRKNCSVIRVQKHAGQSEGLVIPNSAIDEFLALKDVIVKDGAFDANGEEDRIILSARHKLSLFKHLLNSADNDRDAIITLFKNMFDSGEQKTAFLHEKLPDFYFRLKTGLDIQAMTDSGVNGDRVEAIAYILRILKFFIEKAGDR